MTSFWRKLILSASDCVNGYCDMNQGMKGSHDIFCQRNFAWSKSQNNAKRIKNTDDASYSFKKNIKSFFCLNKQSRAKAATNIVKDEYQSYLSYPKEGITPNVRVELPPMCFKRDFVRDWLYI